jgi:hypothetical protein
VFADGTFSFSTASYSDGATLFSQIGVSGTLEAGETSANFGGPSAALAGPVNAAFYHDVNTTLDLHGFYELEATVDVAMTIPLSGGVTSNVVQQLTISSFDFAFEGDSSVPGALLLFGIDAIFAGTARRKVRA